ncbi:MAG: LamG domain-containing protein [Verrucomicrobia bacterium]|nr:LamG domain-containing protein [Verrucomicrobiota bacterium]
MKTIPLCFGRVGALLWSLALMGGALSRAAVFPTTVTVSDNVRIEVTDTTGSLSWNPPAITPTPNALTVMAWVKISLPSNTTLSENMTVLANRRTTDWNQPHAYRIYFNINTGNLEFTARGTSGSLTPIVLVPRPYLDRWYHLAVVRSGTNYTPYIDGRSIQSYAQDIGTVSNTDGLSIGGFKGGDKFWGEVQEVAIFQQALNRSTISTQMFRDIAAASFPMELPAEASCILVHKALEIKGLRMISDAFAIPPS